MGKPKKPVKKRSFRGNQYTSKTSEVVRNVCDNNELIYGPKTIRLEETDSKVESIGYRETNSTPQQNSTSKRKIGDVSKDEEGCNDVRSGNHYNHYNFNLL